MTAARASNSGFQNPMFTTRLPTRSRLVTFAAATAAANGSKNPT